MHRGARGVEDAEAEHADLPERQRRAVGDEGVTGNGRCEPVGPALGADGSSCIAVVGPQRSLSRVRPPIRGAGERGDAADERQSGAEER